MFAFPLSNCKDVGKLTHEVKYSRLTYLERLEKVKQSKLNECCSLARRRRR